jgi:citrate lyase subunit beta / citryl-CoA lyase
MPLPESPLKIDIGASLSLTLHEAASRQVDAARPFPIAPLFVPANRAERISKAWQSGADGVIVDLEDAVAPEQKCSARTMLSQRPEHLRNTIVRINGTGTPWFVDDLAMLRDMPIMGVMLPKVETADDVTLLLDLLGRPVPVLLLVETTGGIARLRSILRASGVWGAAFGSLDYALDLGSEHKWEALLAARSKLVFECRLACLPPPLDGVSTAIDRDEPVVRDARRARALGFGGKLIIHPRQVMPVFSVFRPSAEDILWEERVVAAAQNGAAVQVDGRMVDRPIIERARRILHQVNGHPETRGRTRLPAGARRSHLPSATSLSRARARSFRRLVPKVSRNGCLTSAESS